MTHAASFGAVIYAKDLAKLTAFYQALLALQRGHATDEFVVLAASPTSTSQFQLVVHAIPPHIANTFEINQPPEPRSETAIKLFFAVSDLAESEQIAKQNGGGLMPERWQGPKFVACNGIDCEGNIFQLRQFVN
jgi:predicted enzyme related to lactoylglutathione lyase